MDECFLFTQAYYYYYYYYYYWANVFIQAYWANVFFSNEFNEQAFSFPTCLLDKCFLFPLACWTSVFFSHSLCLISCEKKKLWKRKHLSKMFSFPICLLNKCFFPTCLPDKYFLFPHDCWTIVFFSHMIVGQVFSLPTCLLKNFFLFWQPIWRVFFLFTQFLLGKCFLLTQACWVVTNKYAINFLSRHICKCHLTRMLHYLTRVLLL